MITNSCKRNSVASWVRFLNFLKTYPKLSSRIPMRPRYALRRLVLILATMMLAAADALLAQQSPTVVTRAEALGIAERYLRLVWKPTEHNVLHGLAGC